MSVILRPSQILRWVLPFFLFAPTVARADAYADLEAWFEQATDLHTKQFIIEAMLEYAGESVCADRLAKWIFGYPGLSATPALGHLLAFTDIGETPYRRPSDFVPVATPISDDGRYVGFFEPIVRHLPGSSLVSHVRVELKPGALELLSEDVLKAMAKARPSPDESRQYPPLRRQLLMLLVLAGAEGIDSSVPDRVDVLIGRKRYPAASPAPGCGAKLSDSSSP